LVVGVVWLYHKEVMRIDMAESNEADRWMIMTMEGRGKVTLNRCGMTNGQSGREESEKGGGHFENLKR